uniref:uncharacterized protein LOC122605018 n=1 Tax=Erigeron canadensis TaxID=72917 RepID=UPI001CB9C0D9|nr:uncharacterized protein LOC122605018 [Erigeron canadensis]
MASNESNTKLKHFGFLKDIVVKLVVLLSNVYDFAKENSCIPKTTIESVENVVGLVVKPVYEILKDMLEEIFVFVDDKFDKYAPESAITFVEDIESLINKYTPIVQNFLVTVLSIVTPPITVTIFIQQKVLEITIYLLQKVLEATKCLQKIVSAIKSALLDEKEPASSQSVSSPPSAPLVDAAQSALQNTLDTTTSILQNTLDASTSLLQNPVLEKGSDVANEALDATKSVIGGIPLVGNAAQSLIPGSTLFANRMVQTPSSIQSRNVILDAVNSTAQSYIQSSQETATKATIQSAYMTFKLVAIPIIVEFWYKVNTYPLLHVVSQALLPLLEKLCQLYNKLLTYMDTNDYSIAGYLPVIPIEETKTSYNLVKSAMDTLPPAAQEAAAKAKLQSAYLTFKTAGIPVIAELWYKLNTYPLISKLSKYILPVAEKLCQMYNNLVAYLDKNGYGISGYLPTIPIQEMKTAYTLVKTRQDVLSTVGLGNVLG